MRLSLPKGTARGLTAFAIVLIMGVFAPEFVVAQSKSEAQITVRLQELEDTVRTLTGQVEGLQFQLTQMQELLQKMQDDNEFRFQQLEGGAGKKTDAATQSGGATPTGALPQAPAGEQTTDPATTTPPAPLGTDASAPADAGTATGDSLGDSADPLLGTGNSSGALLGTIPEADADALNGGRPLNLNLDSSQELSNGDAEAQYAAGYEAIVRGDYPFAEEQFRQFVALYPKDPQAPDAANWLGEALLQRQAYDEAADVLLTGFQNYGSSARAPDLLLKLGIALAGAGEQDTACRTFFEVAKRYTEQPAAFTQRLADEKAKAKCPV
ncbi:MAG: tol-pal system protein YbgF [Devosia nanyangense]|uniref:Cell division coordinator CpoB n=1 Tax=Devosia nanyangense TaxID=1228055 RepID=A0A933L0M4_9HYPH|nr:tol-pal system protein YbgF [Devosia nanyangense]